MTNTGRMWTLVGLVWVGVTVWLLSPTPPLDTPPSVPATAPPAVGLVEQGRYLATLGNCQGCHTPPGGPAYSGGVAITTPFGTVYGGNLTPSPQGLGGWNSGDFWRALHHGQSRNGRLLSPAFPYTNTTHISRADSDALFAYLENLPPAETPNPPPRVRWPYNTQAALKVWRALYFKPGAPVAQTPTDSAERGAYLARGLAHCSACHATRNGWGGATDLLNLSGGLLPGKGGYAPSLLSSTEGGVQRWTLADTVAFFKNGRNPHASANGTMAEVVFHSTQHWKDADLVALARYLQALPDARAPAESGVQHRGSAGAGTALYKQHCAACHGEQGEGRQLPYGAWAYPPLAGNRAVTHPHPANVIRSILYGGFGAATTGHPQPFGMPPFFLELNDNDVATLATHIRTGWGHTASPVSPLDVLRWRAGGTP